RRPSQAGRRRPTARRRDDVGIPAGAGRHGVLADALATAERGRTPCPGTAERRSDMDLHLAGSVVVVTGGTRGIGLGTVHELAAEGSRPVAVARRAPDPGVLPDAAGFVAADLSDPSAPARVVAEVLARHGRVDGLVNNAAVFDTRDSFEAIEDDLWRATFEV